MKNQKTRLFQGMALIAAIMMIASFFMPWWMCKFSDSQAIWIHGWGLRHNLVGLASAVAADETPAYQTILAWVYLVVSVIIVGLCALTNKKWGVLLIGLTGLGYISYVLIAIFVVVSNRIRNVNIPLQGTASISGIAPVSSIQPGFYLALVAGAFIVTIGIIHYLSSVKHSK